MRGALVPNVDLTRLDAVLLSEAGQYVPPYAAELVPFKKMEIVAWAVKNARYNLPTMELLDWLLEKIDGRSAIEIGAGMGDLGRALKIPMTDSAVQTMPDMRTYYAMLRQPIVDPPPDVERLDALAAVRKYRPRVVVAAWVTHLYLEGITPNGSIHGVDERLLLNEVETYIHIGNDDVHDTKPIMALEHEAFRLPFLFSRGFDRTKNVVRIWKGGQ